MAILDKLYAHKTKMPSVDSALKGRDTPIRVDEAHFVNGNRIIPPFPSHTEQAIFAMGCFWGAEKRFWQLPGVYSTAVGYIAGYTPNPSYEEVCSGKTGHTEAVLVVYDTAIVDFQSLLSVFWQNHNPTQGMRQGNDIGTQYRSGIYTTNETQQSLAMQSRKNYQKSLADNNFGAITTEIIPATKFYYAESYHQQYLAKNPAGYCGLGGTGVCYTD